MVKSVTQECATPEPNLLVGTNILILSASDWSDNAVSNMQIAALLSESNNVVYMETMGGRFPRFSELGRVLSRITSFLSRSRKKSSVKGLDPRQTHIVSPLAIPVHRYQLINWFNTLLLTVQVRRALKRFQMSKPIIWAFSPRWESVIQKIDHKLLVFHCVDGLHTYDSSSAFKRQLERVVRSAGLVFTPGILLERELKLMNPKTYLVGHGCGTQHLARGGACAPPSDMVDIPEPRVVYAGTLANWVDYSLLIEAACRLPNISFVLIGYIHALTPHDQVTKLISLRNVFHLGYKNYSELPQYYRGAAVGIVPYVSNNEHIQYSTPTKFLDYFAAGLPVVSTRFPAAQAMGDLVICAITPEDFINGIEQMTLYDSPHAARRRVEYARNHTWEAQVAKMCECICQNLHEN